MHQIKSSNTSDVYDLLQDAQEFLEATLAAEKLSLAALEHRSRLMTKVSALMKDYDAHQAEMYIDMSPTLKLTFKAFESSASENSSLKDSQPLAEELYEVPPDCNGANYPTTNEASTAMDECDGKDAEVAAAIANAPVPKKKKGFIQRLFRTPSKLISTEKNSATTSQSSEDILKCDAAVNDDASQAAQNESNQEDYLHPRLSSGFYDNAAGSISESGNDIYDDVYACQTSNSAVDSPYQEYEPPRATEHENLEARENSINRQFDIGNMQEVFDKVGIDAKLYDDVSAVKNQGIPELFLPINFSQPPEVVTHEEEYDCIAADPAPPEPVNDDTDNVSVKSATSDYADYNQKWYISVPEAIKQAIIHGPGKRRNGKKLLSAWRRCYCVLFTSHLLMYSDEGDLRPRIVIDLTEPNIEVRKLLKQGSDAKRLKLSPFVLSHKNKPLYEISMKNREEADNWVTALQAVLLRASRAYGQIQPIKQDSEEPAPNYDDIGETYDEIGGSAKMSDPRGERIEMIQGRDLPSLPQREGNPIPPAASKPSLNSLNSLASSTSNNRAETGGYGEIFASKQSSNEESVDDFYQELPSPAGSVTPYSSIESINSPTNDDDNMYSSIENIAEKTSSHAPSKDETRSRQCSEIFDWPPPPPADDLPVYDVPPPTVRPLAKENDKVFRYSAADLAEQQELYDVPALSPKPVSNASEKEVELENYDQITAPPRPIETSVQKRGTESKTPGSIVNQNAPKQGDQANQKRAPMNTARFWHDKINANNKKDNLPPVKCLPQPPVESKSVGRSFSRASPPRTPLSSFAELLSSNGGVLKPSALKKSLNSLNSASTKKNEGKILENNRLQANSGSEGKLPSIVLDNNPNQKKERPPRPPAPVRTIPVQKAGGEQPLMFTELKLRQTASKYSQNLKSNERSPEPEKEQEHINQEISTLSSPPVQYKARWAYVATNLLEVSLNSGEVVDVLSKNGPSWLIRARNKKGLVPKEYLVPTGSELLPFLKNGEVPIAV